MAAPPLIPIVVIESLQLLAGNPLEFLTRVDRIHLCEAGRGGGQEGEGGWKRKSFNFHRHLIIKLLALIRFIFIQLWP